MKSTARPVRVLTHAHSLLKVAAARQGVSMTQLATDLVTEALEVEDRKEPSDLLRASTARPVPMQTRGDAS